MPTISTGRSDTRRASILEAARRLLIKRGYQDFVLDDLAKEADVAKGTLFLYFKTKDDLLFATFGELVDRLGEELDVVAASGLRGEALLEKTTRTVLGNFDKNSDFLAQFGGGRFPSCGDKSCDRLMEKFAKNMKRVAAILKSTQSRGKLRFKDPEASAIVLFGLCRSAFLHRRITGASLPLEGRTAWVLEQFLFGTRGRP